MEKLSVLNPSYIYARLWEFNIFEIKYHGSCSGNTRTAAVYRWNQPLRRYKGPDFSFGSFVPRIHRDERWISVRRVGWKRWNERSARNEREIHCSRHGSILPDSSMNAESGRNGVTTTPLTTTKRKSTQFHIPFARAHINEKLIYRNALPACGNVTLNCPRIYGALFRASMYLLRVTACLNDTNETKPSVGIWPWLLHKSAIYDAAKDHPNVAWEM